MYKVTNENAKNLLAKLDQAVIDCLEIPNTMLPENYHYNQEMQGSDINGQSYNEDSQHGRSLQSIIDQLDREEVARKAAHIKRRGTSLKIKNKEIWDSTPERLEVVTSYVNDIDDMPLDMLLPIGEDIDLIEPLHMDEPQLTRNEDSFMAMLCASHKGLIGDDNDNANLTQFRDGFNVLSRVTT